MHRAMSILLMVMTIMFLSACGGGGASSSASTSSTSSPPASSIASLSSSSSSVPSIPAQWLAEHPTGVADKLPILTITTNNRAAITSKTEYVTASYSLKDGDVLLNEGNLEIRGRGNSTWGWVKKPYRLKLESAVELLGMPANRHWVLLANYADKTLVRNDATFRLANKLGMAYTPRQQHLEVYLNDNYVGVYQLAEHIRLGEQRVNIPELKKGDIADELISGGYLMEVDFRMNTNYCAGNGWDTACVNGVNTRRFEGFCVDSSYGMNPVCLDTPDNLLSDDWISQRQYISQYLQDFEAALFGGNFKDADLGYAAYVDVDSVVNYYIVNEFVKNPDGAVASFWLYKPRNGKLMFGPVWDFDLASGNATYDNVGVTSGWHTRQAAWFAQLFRDPAFKEKVKQRWNRARDEGIFEDYFAYIRARTHWLDNAQTRNYNLWSITDFDAFIGHANHRDQASYEYEVNELIDWQRKRLAWMDAQMNQ